MATDLSPRGIRVNTVSPGPIETPIYTTLGIPAAAVDALAENMRSTVALKRFGKAEEVAKTVAFLASSEASYITGEEIAVDGGLMRL